MVSSLFAEDKTVVGKVKTLLLEAPTEATGDVEAGRTETVLCVTDSAVDEILVAGLMAVTIVLTVPPMVAVIVSVTGAVVSPVPALCVEAKVEEPDRTVDLQFALDKKTARTRTHKGHIQFHNFASPDQGRLYCMRAQYNRQPRSRTSAKSKHRGQRFFRNAQSLVANTMDTSRTFLRNLPLSLRR